MTMTKPYPPVSLPDNFSLTRHTFIPTPLPDAEMRLRSLALSLQNDLEVLGYPSRTWDYHQTDSVLEVAIVGGGHTGKSVAFGLQRYGISTVKVFDRHPPGQAGPWRSYARNHTLRTPKEVTGGLDWGIPNLNFRRWCEARYGETYWQELKFIPRLVWADYLDWYGEVLHLPLQPNTFIHHITWDATQQYFCLQTAETTLRARFVVLATGMDGAGGKQIPAIVHRTLPSTCYAHTADPIDFSQLVGKRLVVVGGGASAFDTANAALAAGADRVDIVLRRATLPNINRIRWSEWNGYHRHYIDLDDRAKWEYTLAEIQLGQLPPTHTYYEALSHPCLTLYGDAAITQLEYRNGEIVGTYGDQTLHHDFLICGTGFLNDLSKQPELAAIAPHLLRWQDVYQPDPGSDCAEMANYPYLGNSLELLPKSESHAYLRRMYYLSCGVGWLSGFRAYLSGLQFAAPRVCYDISRQLFLQHQPEIRAAFDRYAVVEYPKPDFSS
jgi:cation diffusion facilitator CzcD-associated flavoprotein CzcO